jgi:hypothetical protein
MAEAGMALGEPLPPQKKKKKTLPLPPQGKKRKRKSK